MKEADSLTGLKRNESCDTIEQSHSTKQESLLMTFSGNAFPSNAFGEKKLEISSNNLPSPPTSLNSKFHSFESPLPLQKGHFFSSKGGQKLTKPVKVKRGESPSNKGHKKTPSNLENHFSKPGNNSCYRSTLTANLNKKDSLESAAKRMLTFEEPKFDFNEFLQDSHQEPSPDILQRLMAENEQLKEKTKNNEEMVQKLLGNDCLIKKS